ncbi:hypothetical protein Bca4012_064215 [Brassica carinata]
MGSKLPFRNHYRKDSFERDSRYRPRSPDPKARTNQRKWRPNIHQSHVSERRGLDRSNFKGIERSSNRERHLHVPDTSSRSREYPNSKQVYREVSRAQNNARREETGDTPKYRSPPFRGAPLRSEHTTRHQDALEEILGEGRQAMVQLRATQDKSPSLPLPTREQITPTERVHVSMRLGIPLDNPLGGDTGSGKSKDNADRLPAFQRLGPISQPPPLMDITSGERYEQRIPSAERIPATARLGPVIHDNSEANTREENAERLPAFQRLGPISQSSPNDGYHERR